MSRVRLLTDGGWYFLDRVKFPVEVEAVIETLWSGSEIASVTADELKRVGANYDWCVEADSTWYFYIDSECEVLS